MQSLLFDMNDDDVKDDLDSNLTSTQDTSRITAASRQASEGSGTKVCIKCNRALPFSCFRKRGGGEVYLRTECRECDKALGATRRQLKAIHGYPPEDYTCPICGLDRYTAKGQSAIVKHPWVLDHDHKSKEFRGWLCQKCNKGLGAFNDNVNMLWNAIEYLDNED
tara:strand:+ start:198 stop:692 length:495 start_codon:yes stop_codon:yes gene_type:complete